MRRVILLLAFSVFGCSSEDGPPLSVTDVTVTRPLPGTAMSAGYFAIENRGGSEILVTSVDSPQFARVDMHETVIENDVSRMRSIDALRIASGEHVQFEPGGKHLMLMQPRAPLEAVTLNFYSGEMLLLSVTATPVDP